MKVGIITPSYNQGWCLDYTVQSVINQSRRVNYYAIYDACSADQTAAVLAKYTKHSAVHKIIIEKDSGQADAINRGFDEMPDDIDVMAYLNSDDLLDSDTVKIVMKLFEERPEIDLITGTRRIIGPKGRKGIACRSYPRCRNDLLLNVGIHQETTFWRRSLYKRAGNFVDKSFHFAMDYDLWLRMSDAGWNPLYLNKVLGYFRVHSNSKTTAQTGLHAVRELNRLREVRGSPPLTSEQFVAHVKALEAREMGPLRFLTWRIKNKLQNKLLLPYYL